MKFIESLASYVPGLIVDRLIKECDDREISQIPWRQKYETVCLFCDVSGFTALSEAMALNGKGAEGLAKHLNSYFGQMLRLIASDGGDVFKFAGDAIIVLWPEGQDDMETTVRRAAQCAYAIQENLDKSLMEEGVRLSVKIGIGFGQVSVMHVGGVYGRVEYLAVGDPLIQAFHAEHKSVSGQVICSKEVWAIISEYFVADCIFPDGYARLDMESRNKVKLVRKTAKMNILRNNMSDSDSVLEGRIKGYVAGAVLPNLNRDSPEDEQWGNELRRCSVLFVNLGLKEQHLLAAAVYDEAMVQVHEVLVTAQKSVYQYEGSINKFLMDDKGSTLIACFGLPPVSHDDDPVRAVLAALLLCEGLYKLGLVASIGITTGDVFCGVVGGKTRREYTVLGDSVNLSARLMQKAGTEFGGVLCDYETKLACRGAVDFITLDEIRVKGKSMAIKVFRPYPLDEPPTHAGVAGFKGPNPYTRIHKYQLQSAIVHRALNSLNPYFFPAGSMTVRPSIIRSSSVKNNSATATTISTTTNEENSRLSANSKSKQSASSQMSEHMRPSGSALRTRRSVVRATLNTTSGTKSDAKLLEIDSGNSSSIKGNRKAFASPSISYRSRPFSEHSLQGITESEDAVEITITVPVDLNMDNLGIDVNTLPPISTSEVTTFSNLLSYSLEMSHRLGFAPQDLTEQDVTLNVLGTRFFLPSSDFSIKWLSAFIYEAKNGLSDEWRMGQPIELVLTRNSEKRKLQSRLALAHRILLERKIMLLSVHATSLTVLEGETGVGKTDLIARFIGKTLRKSCVIYYATASPYALDAFGPYSVIIQQYLDNRVVQLMKTTDPIATRTSVLLDILKLDNRMLRDGALLDECLGTEIGKGKFDDSEVESEHEAGEDDDFFDQDIEEKASISIAELYARRIRLYLYLLLFIANERPVIFILDDAHNMDDESWALTLLLHLAVSKNSNDKEKILGDSKLPDIVIGEPKLMMVISLRPMKTNRTVFRGSCQPYETLTKKCDVTFLKLDGLPPEELEELLLSLLGAEVTSISEQIFKLVEVKCMGNPWMIHHLIDALLVANPPVLVYTLSSDLIFADGESFSSTATNSLKTQRSRGSIVSDGPIDMHVSLVEGFRFENFPIPIAVAKSFGSKIDRLNSCQQMILKTAAKIGHYFKWSFLFNCYPLEGHKYRLMKEMNGLLSQGFVVEIPPQVGDKDKTYHFVSAFFVDLILSLMLQEQREIIDNKIIMEQNAIESRTRKQFLNKAMMSLSSNSNKILKSGILEIQKKISDSIFKSTFKRPIQGGDWKQRYCTITANELSMYRDKSHFTSTPGSPTQIIFFSNAGCEVEPPFLHDGREFVLHIDAVEYQKEKTHLFERRRFIFSAESAIDIEDWVYMIKYAIEMHETNSNSRASVSTNAPPAIKPNEVPDESLDSRNASLNDTSDMYLNVHILSTRSIISTEVYGSSNCYISCAVDDDLQRTTVLFGNSRNHSWNSKFVFPLSKEQWSKSELVVNVLDKDLFLTDDILGTRLFDISTIPFTEASTENSQWLELCGREGSYAGDVEISLSLQLGKKYSDAVASGESIESIVAKIMGECKKNTTISNAKTKVVIQRLNSMDEIKSILSIASESDNVNDAAIVALPSKKVKQPARSAAMKKMLRKINDILHMISEENPVVIPTTQSGSVNKMWICQELRPLMGKLHRASTVIDDTLNPYAHILEQASDLDQQHLDWLSSQYTQDASSLGKPSESLPQPPKRMDKSAVLSKIKAEEKSKLEGSSPSPSRRASLINFESPVDLDLSFSQLSKNAYKIQDSIEPPVFDESISQYEGYYYIDIDGNVVGPFDHVVMYENFINKNLHIQVPVRHGSDKNGKFYPFAMFEGTLRKIYNKNVSIWPTASNGFHFEDVHPIHNYSKWDFDIWDLEVHEICPLTMIIMSTLGFSESFHINASKWRCFMDKIETYMTKHNNPYHNYYHIADVMQTCFIFLTKYEMLHMFHAYELLGLIVGAIVHDLDHPGTNNPYQINAKTRLALLYNDISVLENHHCATAFDIITHPKTNIFENLDLVTYKSVRKIMISIILATDMTCHFSLKGDLDSLISRKFTFPAGDDQSPVSVVLDDKDREILLKTVLHISDISNPAKCWKISKCWSDLVLNEFFEQGDKEKREGLPLSPNMDRDTTHQDELSINFADFIVAPFFFALTSIIPNLSAMCVQLESNRDQWHNTLITRLKNTNSVEVAEETIQKWEKRRSTFGNTVSTIRDNSVSKADIASRIVYSFK